VSLVAATVELPLAWRRVFGLEAGFGFNRMSERLFLRDLLVKGLMTVAIGGPLLALVLWIMAGAGCQLVAVGVGGVGRLRCRRDGTLPDHRRAAVQPFHAAAGGASCGSASRPCWHAAASPRAGST
jgi:hypothetical protein